MLLKFILFFGLFATIFATIYRNDVDRDHYQANSECKAFSHLPEHRNRCVILYNEEFCYHNPGKWEPVEIEIGGIYNFPNPTKIESFYKRKGKDLFGWSNNPSHSTLYPDVLKIKTIIVVKQILEKCHLFIIYKFTNP